MSRLPFHSGSFYRADTIAVVAGLGCAGGADPARSWRPAGRSGGRTIAARGSRRRQGCSALAPKPSRCQRIDRRAARYTPVPFRCGRCRPRKRLRLAGRLRRGDGLARTPIVLPEGSAAARSRASEASGSAMESQRGPWRGGRAPIPGRARERDRRAGRDREAAHRPAAQQHRVEAPTTPAHGVRLGRAGRRRRR
jgi:hypothetical protein